MFFCLPIFPSMEDTQYGYITGRDLVTNFILRHENAPDFPPPEARKLLPETRLRWYPLDAADQRTRSARGRGGIDRLQEVVQSAQVRIGRFGPAERHNSAPRPAARRSEALHPSADLVMVNRGTSVNFSECGQRLSVTFLIKGEISLNRLFDDPASRPFKPFRKAV
jgi:hypothetical protein